MTTATVDAPSTGSALYSSLDSVAGDLHTPFRYAALSDIGFMDRLIGYERIFSADSGIFATTDEQVDDEFGGRVAAVETIEGLVNELGVPRKDLLMASGIKKRTFYSWKRKPTTAPRLASQARLWALVSTIDSLREVNEEVGSWLKADPNRLMLLRAGRLSELEQEAFRRDSFDGLMTHGNMAMAICYSDQSDEAAPIPPSSDRRPPKVQRARQVRTPSRQGA